MARRGKDFGADPGPVASLFGARARGVLEIRPAQPRDP
jgi:hypothetical protein